MNEKAVSTASSLHIRRRDKKQLATHQGVDVEDGRPRPRVSWWLGGQSLQSRQQQASGRRVSSVARLPPLGRHHLLQQLLCRASNHQQPLTAAVTIDMLLAPVTTRLLGKNRPLSAGQTYEVACESLGSRPPARISWSSDGEPLSGDRQTCDRK
ncbi:nephrin-like [Schistocerca nitens]|uniref:nephrin-like n=1 Tax=Schistocerca nitens TaxID=7011 RepID=UPI0021182DC1|nr:nephrin-like [Schistocerca nitens]